MEDAIKWVDPYDCRKDRVVLTQNELNIPGIRLFAHQKAKNARKPLPQHYHENAYEFTFITKGSMHFFSDGRPYELSGGDIFVSFPNETHSTGNAPISINEQYWFQLDVSNPSALLFLNRKAAKDLINSLNVLNQNIISVDEAQFRPLIKQAFELAKGSGNMYFVASYFMVMLNMILLAQQGHRHSFEDIENAIQFIHTHLGEDVSLEYLASLSGLSLSHFKLKFRNAIGMAPRSYINTCKIEQAKELLLSKNSVTSTAMLLGFETSSYFSNVFKKHTLLSPKQFFKKYAKKDCCKN